MTGHDTTSPGTWVDDSVSGVLRALVRHPLQRLVRRWNWKSAVLSSRTRALLFSFANLSAGREAATAAFVTEVWFRLATSGFYGTLTEALREVRPPERGMVAAMVILPTLGHGLELLVHWSRGTAELSRSIGLSIAFTMLTTAFNLFAMRRGALVVRAGCQPLHRDLRRMPHLIAEFVVAIVAATTRLARVMTGFR